MQEAADRYLRQGTDVPAIYPGTLEGMSQAMRDVRLASSRVPGEHLLSVVSTRRGRSAWRLYEDGQLTWTRDAGWLG